MHVHEVENWHRECIRVKVVRCPLDKALLVVTGSDALYQ
jgi:hypothetical protein